MKKPVLIVGAVLVLAAIALTVRYAMVVQARPGKTAGAGQALPAAQLDGLLAPIALYPDQLLAQILLCATDPAGVTSLDKFLKGRPA
jgi:hypothetical protein